MVRQFKPADEGNDVYSADGDKVGTVSTVSGDRIHVKPDGSLSRSIRQKLGWSDDDETYELSHAAVMKMTDDEIHLSESF